MEIPMLVRLVASGEAPPLANPDRNCLESLPSEQLRALRSRL
jgi:hypothetical protein